MVQRETFLAAPRLPDGQGPTTILESVVEYRKIAESKPLTLQGSDYAHAVRELQKVIKGQVKYRFLVATAVCARCRTSNGESSQRHCDYQREKRDRFFSLFSPLRVRGLGSRQSPVPRFPLAEQQIGKYATLDI